MKLIIKALIIAGLFLIFGSCTAKYYKKSADKEVYKIIKEKKEDVKEMPSNFTIERENHKFTSDDFQTTDSKIVTLPEAIDIALNNSRDYQSSKENLYSTGLSLTESRHTFDPIFSGSLSGKATRSKTKESVSSAISLGTRKMIATGADISVNIGLNLFRYISGGDPGKASGTSLSASVTQPLLRGAGRKVALEELTQAERNMIYAVRDFVRYRKKFSTNIAKKYYDTLQLKAVLDNNWRNFQDLKKERERAELLMQAGRLPAFQVDQTKQNELSAEASYIRNKESYENGLDNFKMTLGLPSDAPITLDPQEMEKLVTKGTVTLTLSLDNATSIALAKRLDFKTIKDRVDDSERRIYIAKNSLLPKLNMIFNYQNSSKSQNKPLSYSSNNETSSIGLDIDPMLDRKSIRNSYRRALINYDAVKRNFEENKDNIKLEVRNSFRSLEQTEKSYVIQKNAVMLAEKRVESTTMLQEAGRATTRDVLDARESLLSAQNSLTETLVSHFNARLDLFVSMESLRIDDNGLWMEDTNLEEEQ